MNRPETFRDLFTPRPSRQWGLRGDPYLWTELAETLGNQPLPRTYGEFAMILENAFEKCTGTKISARGQVYVERYAHGGMSSGHISLEFWQTKGLPALLKRFSNRFETEY